MKSTRRLALLFSLAALAASSAMAHERRIRAGDLPTCSETTPDSVWLLDAASATTCDGTTGEFEAHCCCANGAWAACGGSGGGSGDVEAVWGCTSGDCSTLTAASGDSLDAGSADAASPATRSTSLPGTCSEGQLHQDTDSGGSETYVCTASNTWTKLSTTATVEDDDVAPYGQYDPDNPPASVGTGGFSEEFTGDATSLSFTCAGNANTTLDYAEDSLRTITTGSSSAIDRYICTVAAPSGDWVLSTKISAAFSSSIPMCGLVAIHSGTQTAPTSLTQAIYYRNGSRSFIGQTATSLTSATSNLGSADDAGLNSSSFADIYLQLRYDSGADTLRACYSLSGLFGGSNLSCHTRTSVTSDPTFLGILTDDLEATAGVSAYCYFRFLRLRTDATGTADPFAVGE